MEARAQSIEALATPLIAQCRREIAAAWVQIEAAKEMLARGRWLLARWAEQIKSDAERENERLKSAARSEAARVGMFVMVEPERLERRPRSRRRSRPAKAAPARPRQRARVQRYSALMFAALMIGHHFAISAC
jgi:hypothetical protein